MKEERYYIALDKYDKNIMLNALNTLRTQQIQEERPTDPVDELISTVAHAPTKKVRVVEKRVPEKSQDFLGEGGATERAGFCPNGAKRAERSLQRRCYEER